MFKTKKPSINDDRLIGGVKPNKICGISQLINILLIYTTLFLYPATSYSNNFDLTLAGEIESDPASKEKELLVQLKHQDDEKKYLNEISLKNEHGYQVSSGEVTKYKELFDYEQNLQFFFKEQKSFVTLYFRYKDDQYSNALGQNYHIYSVGYGLQKEHEKEKISFQFSLGQKHNAEDDVIIARPSISYQNEYKNFLYHLSYSLVRGSNFKTQKSKVSISYPISKTISLKYIIEYENSTDIDGDDYDKLNKMALSIKF